MKLSEMQLTHEAEINAILESALQSIALCNDNSNPSQIASETLQAIDAKRITQRQMQDKLEPQINIISVPISRSDMDQFEDVIERKKCFQWIFPDQNNNDYVIHFYPQEEDYNDGND